MPREIGGRNNARFRHHHRRVPGWRGLGDLGLEGTTGQTHTVHPGMETLTAGMVGAEKSAAPQDYTTAGEDEDSKAGKCSTAVGLETVICEQLKQSAYIMLHGFRMCNCVRIMVESRTGYRIDH